MESTTWFITGASRGLGLEFVRQLTRNPRNIVIASCRSPDTATELNAQLAPQRPGYFHIVQLDVSSAESIKVAATKVDSLLEGRGLDVLFNNAAINPGNDTAYEFEPDTFSRTMQSNVVGPALIAKSFLPFLKKSHKGVIVNMSSGLASIGKDLGPKCCMYSMSKAALNMLTYKQAKAEAGIVSLVIDPGWNKTAMGGEGALLEPEHSVSLMIPFIEKATLEHSGRFFSYDGSPCEW